MREKACSHWSNAKLDLRSQISINEFLLQLITRFVKKTAVYSFLLNNRATRMCMIIDTVMTMRTLREGGILDRGAACSKHLRAYVEFLHRQGYGEETIPILSEHQAL